MMTTSNLINLNENEKNVYLLFKFNLKFQGHWCGWYVIIFLSLEGETHQHNIVAIKRKLMGKLSDAILYFNPI